MFYIAYSLTNIRKSIIDQYNYLFIKTFYNTYHDAYLLKQISATTTATTISRPAAPAPAPIATGN